mmetsp:Transcript_70025/g.154898  ORF Transcript_70025/g.154898 Transcript_70025/m.154898 type:complete len:544 (-) Transcript_70025:112-1743(-)
MADRLKILIALVAMAAGTEPQLSFDTTIAEALTTDDECLAATDECAISALQLRAARAASQADNAALASGDSDGASAAQNLTLLDVRRYEGVAWMPLTVADSGTSSHVFAIGDWGTLLPGHYTAPNVRPAGSHNKCPYRCDYVRGVDDKAQLLVADQMKRRAARSNPQYILNVGDNFYWTGLKETCGLGGGLHSANGITTGSFATVWSSVYGSLTRKPWISALGNHDYGGWQFNAGWDQQIAFTFRNPNWVMPARYFSRLMHHPGFSVEVFVIDSNAFDAKSPNSDPEHNICGALHNPPGANCAASGGPSSVHTCKDWFWNSYRTQQRWLEGKLSASTADWQVVVTHFPCGHDSGWYAKLHKQYGLDLLVTGHRHDQELWSASHALGGLTCIVTGGGGGITSEGTPHGDHSSQYGFFDLTFSKDSIEVELVNFRGNVIRRSTVGREHQRKHESQHNSGGSCASYGCGGFDPSQSCQCNANCKSHGNCCSDASICWHQSEHHSQHDGGGSCAAYGCGGFDPSQTCQCNANCKSHGNCCSDASKCW